WLERHGLVAGAALGTIVLPAEGHAALIQRDEPAVGDGHSMRVARQVGQHSLGPGEGTLGVDDPFALPQRRKPADEGTVLAEELQPAIVVSSKQLFEEAPAEQL